MTTDKEKRYTKLIDAGSVSGLYRDNPFNQVFYHYGVSVHAVGALSMESDLQVATKIAETNSEQEIRRQISINWNKTVLSLDEATAIENRLKMLKMALEIQAALTASTVVDTEPFTLE